MNIKQICNSRKVYEGWFESYFIEPWIRRYADFGGAENRRDTLCSLSAWLTVTLGLVGLLLGLVGLLGPEVGFVCLYSAGGLWLAASVVPMLALLTRMTRGGDAVSRRPRMLGIDILMMVSCGLFFVFGLLMMLTTINSETLHAPAGTVDEEETMVTDTVVEEALFTYQNPVIDTVAPQSDTMADLSEPDVVSPDESFDPTIETEVNTETPDTVNYF